MRTCCRLATGFTGAILALPGNCLSRGGRVALLGDILGLCFTMDTMVRMLIALLFAFLSFTAPVNADCSYDSPDTASCCCSASGDSNCVELRSICCDLTDPTPALPARSDSEFVPARVVFSLPTLTLAPPALAVAPELTVASAPANLANNKIYLLKRSLLI